MTSHTKRRVFQHIMEDQSLNLLRSLLPEEWAMHQYSPDYGIDQVVEVFKYIDADKLKADTLGDLFFVQLKALKNTKIQRLVIRSRGNIEKGELRESNSKTLTVEVVPFVLDTDELLTVQAMGASVPVILIVTCLDLGKAFFVCLNDVIDKIIVPSDPSFHTKKHKTIHVPCKNVVSRDAVDLVPLRFYAKRAKFYAAFAKFQFQRSELEYFFNGSGVNSIGVHTYRHEIESSSRGEREFRAMVRHFIRIIKRFNIWTDCEMWEIVSHYYELICELDLKLDDSDADLWDVVGRTQIIWNGLTVLASNYEELCREWFLPTHLSQ